MRLTIVATAASLGVVTALPQWRAESTVPSVWNDFVRATKFWLPGGYLEDAYEVVVDAMREPEEKSVYQWLKGNKECVFYCTLWSVRLTSLFAALPSWLSSSTTTRM